MVLPDALRRAFVALLMLALPEVARAESGYEAWLRYPPIVDAGRLEATARLATAVTVEGPSSPVVESAVRELERGFAGLLGRPLPRVEAATGDGAIVLSCGDAPTAKAILAELAAAGRPLAADGFVLRSTRVGGRACTAIVSGTDRGALYGAFALLRRVQSGGDLRDLDVRDEPAMPLRIVKHWDNLDGTIERGYAGPSIFRWDALPALDDRYRDYARLLASLGIAGLGPNNESGFQGASTKILTPEYLKKAAALAVPFREYGIRLYFAVGFDAPKVVGGLPTSDPLDPAVRAWWRAKADELYALIPDCGGFVVKADSEGQPGPHTYGRTHADGANVLAEALAPHGGVVLWRTFVYRLDDTDRARMGYDTFKPLDGQFAQNVVLYAMTFPIDFLTREPVAPLFGRMPRSNMMVEAQIVQEYNGQDVHLCYLVPQWRDVLRHDTHAKGEGSAVSKVVDGTLHGARQGGMSGVPNVGRDPTWLGHPLHMANFYGYGRLAWDPELSPEAIAEEWTRLTFGGDPDVVRTITAMLLASHAIYESYTAPLGLGVLHDAPDHIDPAPHYRYRYHRADPLGVGTDRTVATGSGFAGLYHPPLAKSYEDVATTPEELLLFFHHVPYAYRMRSGKTLIQTLYDLHFDGVERAKGLRAQWRTLAGKIDAERFALVSRKLDQQVAHAAIWRDAVNLFFFQLSGVPDERGRVRSDYRLALPATTRPAAAP